MRVRTDIDGRHGVCSYKDPDSMALSCPRHTCKPFYKPCFLCCVVLPIQLKIRGSFAWSSAAQTQRVKIEIEDFSAHHRLPLSRDTGSPHVSQLGLRYNIQLACESRVWIQTLNNAGSRPQCESRRMQEASRNRIWRCKIVEDVHRRCGIVGLKRAK